MASTGSVSSSRPIRHHAADAGWRQVPADHGRYHLAKLVAHGLTPLDVVNAVNAQSLTLPAGTAKFGNTQYVVRTNATPSTIDDLNNIPIKVVTAQRSSSGTSARCTTAAVQQKSCAKRPPIRPARIIKNGNASTLAVVKGVKAA